MTPQEVKAAIQPWLTKQRRPAWKPIIENGDASPTASKFCGTPWIGPDSPWPDCGICHQPLPLFLQLDLETLPEELGQCFGQGLLQLFYCTREECQGEGGWEPFADDLSRVRVVHPNGLAQFTAHSQQIGPFPAKRIVGWSRFTDLPSPSEHDELGLIYKYNFGFGTLQMQCPELNFDVTHAMKDCPAEEITLAELGDKLAGWPAWIQYSDYPHCPRCKRRMVHLFQLDSEDNIPFMFGDLGGGHVTQCPDHKEIVAFGWDC